MLLELPPIPGSSKMASQDAKRSTSRRMPAKQKRQDVVFCVNTAPRASADPGSSKTASQDAKRSTSRRMPAKKLAEDRHPPVRATRCRVFRELSPRASARGFYGTRHHP